MTTRKNASSTVKATKKGEKTLYLCNRDEQTGLDMQLDLLGYTVVAL